MKEKYQSFVVTYENIGGKEVELTVSAKTHVQACELAESEDPDLGQIFSVCTEKEHALRKNRPENHIRKYVKDSFLSI